MDLRKTQTNQDQLVQSQFWKHRNVWMVQQPSSELLESSSFRVSLLLSPTVKQCCTIDSSALRTANSTEYLASAAPLHLSQTLTVSENHHLKWQTDSIKTRIKMALIANFN